MKSSRSGEERQWNLVYWNSMC